MKEKQKTTTFRLREAENSAKRRNGNQHLCWLGGSILTGNKRTGGKSLLMLMSGHWINNTTMHFIICVRVAMLTLRFTTHIVSHFMPPQSTHIHPFRTLSLSFEVSAKVHHFLRPPAYTHRPIWIYEIHSLFRLNLGSLGRMCAVLAEMLAYRTRKHVHLLQFSSYIWIARLCSVVCIVYTHH